jgi:hypothetical protein
MHARRPARICKTVVELDDGRAREGGTRWDGDGVGLTAMRYGLPPNKPPKTQ